jgi:hypothetical protein
MAYTTYNHFTRKQCNVLFKAFKSGDLTPPKDCRGKVKRPGFVYGYEGRGIWHGMYLDKDEHLFNGQLLTLMDCVGLVIEGNLEKAQAMLDGEVGDSSDKIRHFPDWVEKKKMWKAVF